MSKVGPISLRRIGGVVAQGGGPLRANTVVMPGKNRNIDIPHHLIFSQKKLEIQTILRTIFDFVLNKNRACQFKISDSLTSWFHWAVKHVSRVNRGNEGISGKTRNRIRDCPGFQFIAFFMCEWVFLFFLYHAVANLVPACLIKMCF